MAKAASAAAAGEAALSVIRLLPNGECTSVFLLDDKELCVPASLCRFNISRAGGVTAQQQTAEEAGARRHRGTQRRLARATNRQFGEVEGTGVVHTYRISREAKVDVLLRCRAGEQAD